MTNKLSLNVVKTKCSLFHKHSRVDDLESAKLRALRALEPTRLTHHYYAPYSSYISALCACAPVHLHALVLINTCLTRIRALFVINKCLHGCLPYSSLICALSSAVLLQLKVKCVCLN